MHKTAKCNSYICISGGSRIFKRRFLVLHNFSSELVEEQKKKITYCVCIPGTLILQLLKRGLALSSKIFRGFQKSERGWLKPQKPLQICHCVLLITVSVMHVFHNQIIHTEQQGNNLGFKIKWFL